MEGGALELGVVFFRGVQIGENPVASGEVSAGHVDAREHILLLYFDHVEQYGEALGVQQNDDARIGKQRRPRRHIHSENGALIFLHAILEERISPFHDKVIETIQNGYDDGQAIAPRDLLHII